MSQVMDFNEFELGSLMKFHLYFSHISSFHAKPTATKLWSVWTLAGDVKLIKEVWGRTFFVVAEPVSSTFLVKHLAVGREKMWQVLKTELAHSQKFCRYDYCLSILFSVCY